MHDRHEGRRGGLSIQIGTRAGTVEEVSTIAEAAAQAGRSRAERLELEAHDLAGRLNSALDEIRELPARIVRAIEAERLTALDDPDDRTLTEEGRRLDAANNRGLETAIEAVRSEGTAPAEVKVERSPARRLELVVSVLEARAALFHYDLDGLKARSADDAER
jgi:hypothetical protein